MLTATVITSTIGRPELHQCIESVRAQTHPVRHFVFVNGKRHWEAARRVLDVNQGVTAFYLPEDTGDYGMGPSMADVFAGAPFLTRADWVFFLDDDNFYDPDHVESCLALAKEHDLAWTYSLRRFVDRDGSPVCEDDFRSLGHWPVFETNDHLVDNSCYAVSRKLAQRCSRAWTALPFVADRCFFAILKDTGERAGCTGRSTVNYRIGTGTALEGGAHYRICAEEVQKLFPNGFPWRKPQIFSSAK